jgi:hypothetical protein
MAMLEAEANTADRRKYRFGAKAWWNFAPPGASMKLIAAALLVLVALGAVAGFFELHRVIPASTPAGTESVRLYQTMLARDYHNMEAGAAQAGNYCLNLQDTCPAPGRPFQVALQQTLDDLDRSEPPAKFAVIDAQLRRHLSADISILNASFSAYGVHDQSRFSLAGNAAQNEWGWLGAIERSIIDSQQASAATYIEFVRPAQQQIAGCTACLSLAASSHIDCTGSRTLDCQAQVIKAAGTIESIEASVVLAGAPSSLESEDAALQLDLAQADTALLSMGTAIVAGDQTGFDAARVRFPQELTAVNVDIAAILGS